MKNTTVAPSDVKQNGHYQGPIQPGIIPPNAPLPDRKVEVPETPDKHAAEANDEREKEPLFGPQNKRVILTEKGGWVNSSRETLQGMRQEETVYTGAIRDHTQGSYWYTTPEDTWVKANETAVQRYLTVNRSIKATPDRKGEPSQLDAAMDTIARIASVDQVTQLAGYSKGVYEFQGNRILVPKSPTVIGGREGDWRFIKTLLTQFLGEEQLEYFLGWLSWGRLAFVTGSFAPGQVNVFAGPPSCGKNAVLDLIVTPILGGRSGNPFQYMVGQTTFNGEIAKAEHLIISDQPPTGRYEDKVAFGARIKDLSANQIQRIHSKGKDAFSAEVFWRISVAVNDDDNSFDVLPPLDVATLEKMMLFRVSQPDILPGNTLTARQEFADRIRKGLPAFVYYLENEHRIRPEVAASKSAGRFGIDAYHHPIFINDLMDSSPEGGLWDMMERAGITKEYDGSELGNCGKMLDIDAAGIFDKLLKDPATQEEARKTLRSSRQVGKMMSKLQSRPGSRIMPRTGRARTRFFSFAPSPSLDE
jgi:hypothetical protein